MRYTHPMLWNNHHSHDHFSDVKGGTPTPLLEALAEELHHTNGRRILEAGGAPGNHAIWLAERGFDVALVDYSMIGLRRVDANLTTYEHENQARARLQITTFRQEITHYLRYYTQDIRRFDVFYANSLFHTFDAEERKELYDLVRTKSLEGHGLLAVSFKAKGDVLDMHPSREIREEAAGVVKVSTDLWWDDGIERLFVSDPEPLIVELRNCGFEVKRTYRWHVDDYNIFETRSEFIGFLATKS